MGLLDWDEPYELLLSWLERMMEYSPRSTYKLETDNFVFNNQVDNQFRKFHSVFWMFRPTCDAINFCKPIIQIDDKFSFMASIEDDVNCYNTR